MQTFISTATAADDIKLVARYIKKYGKRFVDHLDISERDAVTMLKLLDKQYHAKSKPLVDDEVYDILHKWFITTHPNNTYNGSVGSKAEPAKGVSKVRLLVRMMSLSKLNPDSDLKEFGKLSSYTITEKLDGISLAVLYEGGRCVAVHTRGDGTIGEDVSGLIPALNVPKTVPKDMQVRLEFVMKRKGFASHDKKNGGKFTTARNMGGGIIRRNKPTPTVSQFDCVAFEILSGFGAGTPQKNQLSILQKYGFTVARHKVVSAINIDILTDLYGKFKKASHYECDGIVVAQNVSYKITDKNPKHARAFKINSLENSLVVPVKEIEWNVSKHNTYIPRIVVEPITLGGVEVKHFTGHSWFYIQHGYTSSEAKKAKRTGAVLKSKPLNVGAQIRVIRSGDVIPYIMEVVVPARVASEPSVPYTLDANGVHAIASDKTDNAKIKRIMHFFNVLGVEGMKSGVVTKLFDYGYDTIQKILRITVEDLLEIEGFQQRSADKLYSNIQTVYANATFARLGYASNVFGKLIGESKLQLVIDSMPNIITLSSKMSRVRLEERIGEIKGIASSADVIVDGLPKLIQFSERLRIPIVRERKEVQASNKLSGIRVLLTGIRDAKFVADIKSHGGVEGSLKTATHIITKPGTSNAKTQYAEENLIPVMSIDEFRRKFKI
jgi:NAD-dependent DNA ligase